MMTKLAAHPLWRGALVVLLLAGLVGIPSAAAAQTPVGPTPLGSTGSGATPTPGQTDPVADLMARMTPEEKIGQLFLTTFGGASAAADTDIAKLIREQHIGGVILSSVNQNFLNSADTPGQIATLVNALQAEALQANRGIPLFVALDHEGDGYPYQRIAGGMTALPNAMAIGATWNPDNAAAAGEIAGRELAAIGFNLLLGPDIDVLYNPRPTGRGDMGTRTFGGDPWWVAQMGRAYICGVHRGGGGRVATVAKHFPGHGGSDRLPDQEIATVDKSLTELRRIELPPFFAVTGAQSADDCAVTDAMMTSHIRYRGLQGNIRQFTAPISFDAEGLSSILGQSEFAAWRSRGLIVSDALGVPAVAKYFDPTERSFPHRQVAKEALMAGNDLLSIDQFARPQAAIIQTTNLADTAAYFGEEYASNAQFRQRVEDAVSRILRAKLRIYGGQFRPESVPVNAKEAAKVTGRSTATVNKMAREAITLLYPQGATLPAPPRRDDDILIFTDAERVKDCRDPACEWYEALPTTAVQDAIVRLYGPSGTGQINPARIQSASFNDLKFYLAHLIEASTPPTATVQPSPTPAVRPTGTPRPDVAALMGRAKWIIFAMRNADRDADSDAVRIFLDNANGRLTDTRLVVLAFNAPYYLDTTQISKLSLYLAAYSKTQPYIDATVRALFGEFTPRGRPPVNVEGINYDLLRQLAPDPSRGVPLNQVAPAAGERLQAPAQVRVSAGPLIDRNGNKVPDGTEVILEAAYAGSGQYAPAVHVSTKEGMAEASFDLRNPGTVDIAARSGDAAQARALRLVIEAPPTPTASPSPEPSRTATPTVTPTPTPSATPEPTPTVQAETTPLPAATPAAPAGPGRPWDSVGPGERAGVLLLALLGTLIAVLAGWPWLRLAAAPPARRLRWSLLAVSGGMAGYILYLVLLPEGWKLPPAAAALAFLGAIGTLPVMQGGGRGTGKAAEGRSGSRIT